MSEEEQEIIGEAKHTDWNGNTIRATYKPGDAPPNLGKMNDIERRVHRDALADYHKKLKRSENEKRIAKDSANAAERRANEAEASKEEATKPISSMNPTEYEQAKRNFMNRCRQNRR